MSPWRILVWCLFFVTLVPHPVTVCGRSGAHSKDILDNQERNQTKQKNEIITNNFGKDVEIINENEKPGEKDPKYEGFIADAPMPMQKDQNSKDSKCKCSSNVLPDEENNIIKGSSQVSEIAQQNLLIKQLLTTQDAFLKNISHFFHKQNHHNAMAEMRETIRDERLAQALNDLQDQRVASGSESDDVTKTLEKMRMRVNEQSDLLNSLIQERQEQQRQIHHMKQQLRQTNKKYEDLQIDMLHMKNVPVLRIAPQPIPAESTEGDNTAAFSARELEYIFPISDKKDHTQNKGNVLPMVGIGGIAFECDFEQGTCGFTQDHTDDFDWMRHSEGTKTDHTGPEKDHTTGADGYYMYIEASLPRKHGHKARLTTPSLGMSKHGYCVQFWYHMYGYSIGILNVYVNTGPSRTLVWTKMGDQGNAWHKAQIMIVARNDVQVTFEAMRSYSSMGDIAIDDVLIRNGKCM